MRCWVKKWQSERCQRLFECLLWPFFACHDLDNVYFRPFHLTLSENHSSVTLYDGLDLGGYSLLQYIPTKANSDFYILEDVLANGQSLEGEHINLLVAVRKVRNMKIAPDKKFYFFNQKVCLFLLFLH